MRRLKKDPIEEAFGIYFNRVQIPLMDIPKIYAEARVRTAGGEALSDVMHSISLRYKGLES